ncbi:hypothetical protein B9479_001663 [Cryptococcus floricola]|uniref:HTH TFE/IIEalpha-type domain-containing protein n=1 Tax=Cryptococcus floricola TaxID=2591691 RepID=A0A5D3B4V7_9TREE|nr:hypothetical protein B9479_001663 [Cryptococcus floricola]
MADLNLSSDEIQKLCSDLVYQVAYSFYDGPYIILFKMMVHFNVIAEVDLAQRVGLSTNEARKYMGILLMHRLVKRYVNKEKLPVAEWKRSYGNNNRNNGPPELRTRDVHYWFLDYREFANVTKYRLAMMRKNIDQRIKSEVGHRGYQCPMDGRTYDPLDLSHLFDPMTNSFKCEDCGGELVEHDPTVDVENNSSLQDMMQRFNIATAPIRDALKAVEGLTLPSINIVAWIAQNVKTGVVSVDGKEMGEEGKKFEVVMGAEDDEDKEKLAQAQREQNALPAWYTHSTVTGDATTLGINDRNQKAAVAERARLAAGGTEQTTSDESLAAHYEMLAEGEEEEEDDEEFEETAVVSGETSITPPEPDEATNEASAEGEGKMVTVAGQPKRVEDVTDEDQDLMTTEEYEAYAVAMS